LGLRPIKETKEFQVKEEGRWKCHGVEERTSNRRKQQDELEEAKGKEGEKGRGSLGVHGEDAMREGW